MLLVHLPLMHMLNLNTPNHIQVLQNLNFDDQKLDRSCSLRGTMLYLFYWKS